jgi:hypothetical protein
MAGDLTVLDGITFFVSDAGGNVEPRERPRRDLPSVGALIVPGRSEFARVSSGF